MKKVCFLSCAAAEFEDAVVYYNEQSEGLGFDFAVEVKRSLKRIVEYPLAWAKLSQRVRRCRLNRFPYGVLYQIREDSILVVVMYLRRRPKEYQTFD